MQFAIVMSKAGCCKAPVRHSLYDVKPPIKDPVSTSVADTYSLSCTVEERFNVGG